MLLVYPLQIIHRRSAAAIQAEFACTLGSIFAPGNLTRHSHDPRFLSRLIFSFDNDREITCFAWNGRDDQLEALPGPIALERPGVSFGNHKRAMSDGTDRTTLEQEIGTDFPAHRVRPRMPRNEGEGCLFQLGITHALQLDHGIALRRDVKTGRINSDC